MHLGLQNSDTHKMYKIFPSNLYHFIFCAFSYSKECDHFWWFFLVVLLKVHLVKMNGKN